MILDLARGNLIGARARRNSAADPPEPPGVQQSRNIRLRFGENEGDGDPFQVHDYAHIDGKRDKNSGGTETENGEAGREQQDSPELG